MWKADCSISCQKTLIKNIICLNILLILTGYSTSHAQYSKNKGLNKSDGDVIRDTWYLPTEDTTARLFVEELGDPQATPIIVLHGGWGAEHSYLDEVVMPFAGRSHRFILYDQRGSLLSPVSDYSEVSLQTQIADFDLLRQTLKIEKLNILAHSMGTFLVMAYMQAHPEHVAALIFTGTMPARPEGGEVMFWKNANEYAQQLIGRPNVQRLLDSVKHRPGLTPKDKTHIWRIQFAATNIYHIEHWTTIPGGQAFYNHKVAHAMDSNK